MDEADTTDVIDEAAGLNPANGAGALRRERPEILRLSQTSHRAALLPKASGNLPRGERAALVCRMARLLKDEALAAHYAGLLDREGVFLPLERSPILLPPALPIPAPAAILHHVDLLTLSPEKRRGDVQKLMSVGLTRPRRCDADGSDRLRQLPGPRGDGAAHAERRMIWVLPCMN